MRPYFREEEMNSACRICSNVVIPPGASVGKHFHYGEEEIYIIVKGRAIVEDDDTKFELGPGDSILTGDGHSHSIRNETEEDLEFIAVINRY